MKTTSSNFTPTTYFTVVPSYSGFTDQMLQFRSFYKLGLSLGYIYLHIPFRSPRSSTPTPKVLEILLFYLLKSPRLGQLLPWELSFDIYDFLGFNQYLKHKITSLWPRKLKNVNVNLNDDLLQANHADSFEGLQRFIRDYVSTNSNREKGETLVRFKLTGKRSFFGLIHSEIPDLQDGLDLRQAYFEARKQNPWRSPFLNDKLKMLVHIRQGDTGVIETPWGTFLPIWKQVPDRFTEHAKFTDIQNGDLFQPTEFYHFVKGLISYFDDDIFSMLCCSDGYERTFKILHDNLGKVNLSYDRIKSLEMDHTSYEKRQFDIFKNIKGSRVVIGEKRENLCDLIHASLQADVIIIGTQQRMLPKLLANYCNFDTTPIVIVLYRKNKPKYRILNLRDKEKRFIYVDITNPNYKSLVPRLMDLIDAKTLKTNAQH